MPADHKYDLDIQRILRSEIADLTYRHKLEIGLIHSMYAVANNGPAKGLPSIVRQCELVRNSELFCHEWYQDTYQEIDLSEFESSEHYVRVGAFEGRDPGPNFNTMDYYLANPDAALASWPALVHYAEIGISEGRPLG
ncbi:hypothetical protein [Erythrobacter ani]|uniref:Uncharacterized protein n=1 Tax=Erythrobacter ani TaxID=2827235 RepID=A0ABS6SPA8_9SPHN|nr:hypothetical protein [Erythrobacter ani]MBV7266327.1 hypothetical protein [Erythrobacter ani]